MTIGISAPFFALAQNSVAAQQGSVLCDKISSAYSKVAQILIQKEGKIISKKTEIINKIQDHWTKQDTNLAQKRQKWDDNRAKQIAVLSDKFSSDLDKKAVISFEQEVSSAISARRRAIDSAITNFRQGVQQLKTSRELKTDEAKKTFKNSVISAFETAKADCLSGVSIAIIRENLKISLATAKEKYNNEVRNIEKIGAGMDQLIATRKAAFQKAIQDFKAAMEKARIEFKSATAKDDPDKLLKESCEKSGGKMATSSCCKSAENFPNLCLVGACGCSLENSKEIKVCDCGESKCFDRNSCIGLPE